MDMWIISWNVENAEILIYKTDNVHFSLCEIQLLT